MSIAQCLFQVVFTLYSTVKRTVAESVLDRAFVHTRNVAFEAVSAPEQCCSAPLLKMERFLSDRFLKRFDSSLNTFIGAEIATEPRMVNDHFKSKGRVADCMADRASVHTGNASEQFLHHNRTLILVHTLPEKLLKRSKSLSGTV